MLDLVREPLYLGSGCLALALLCTAIAGRISKRHNFPEAMSVGDKIRTLIKQPNFAFVLLLVGAGLLVCLGNVLIRRAGTKEAEEISRQAQEKEDRAQDIYRQILTALKPRVAAASLTVTPTDTQPNIVETPVDPYDQWAEAFWRDRGKLVAREIDLEKLTEPEFRVAMSLRWWSTLETAKNIIEKAIAKYNEHAPTKAIIKLAEIPRDFASYSTSDLASIQFSSRVFWTVELQSVRVQKPDLGPVLHIDIPRGREGSNDSSGGLYVEFFNSDEFQVKNYVYGLPRKPTISNERYPMSKFDDVFRDAVLEMVKAQTLLLNAAAPE